MPPAVAPGVGAIILAAGGSTRMGRPKQLLQIEGQTLVRRIVDAATGAGCSPIVVVLGHKADAICQELDRQPVHFAINPDWSRGIGSSIRCGVEMLLTIAPSIERLMLLLCDQPRVSANVLRRVIAAQKCSEKPVCVCAYAGTVGPPVLVDRSLFEQLMSLPDDRGAKALWTGAGEDRVCHVPCEEAAMDIDTPADYQLYLSDERDST
jgi:molybdenum cofactor cytidylyltransferase